MSLWYCTSDWAGRAPRYLLCRRSFCSLLHLYTTRPRGAFVPVLYAHRPFFFFFFFFFFFLQNGRLLCGPVHGLHRGCGIVKNDISMFISLLKFFSRHCPT